MLLMVTFTGQLSEEVEMAGTDEAGPEIRVGAWEEDVAAVCELRREEAVRRAGRFVTW